MLRQPENATVVKPQPFPNGIPALHHRIKWADARFIALEKFPILTVNQVLVDRIVFLKHGLILCA
jgi:hypothetical protein